MIKPIISVGNEFVNPECNEGLTLSEPRRAGRVEWVNTMRIFKKILPYLIILLLIVVIKNNVAFIFEFVSTGSALNRLEKTLVSEENKNKYLQEKLFIVKNDRFVEDEAQNKLGMLKAGEYFVIAPTATPLDIRTFDFDDKPNWKKWLSLFF